jgi:L-fuconate dehydratase
MRECVGPDCLLMVDANQKWGVDQAIAWMEELAQFKLHWIEEPTSPDDVLGHKKVSDALKQHGKHFSSVLKPYLSTLM